MSGDIGQGATRETIAFAAQLALSNDRPPGLCTVHVPRGLYSCQFTNKLLVSSSGFLQLAGGTNLHTVDGLKKENLFQSTSTPSKFDTSPIYSFTMPVSQSWSNISISTFSDFDEWRVIGKIVQLNACFDWWHRLWGLCPESKLVHWHCIHIMTKFEFTSSKVFSIINVKYVVQIVGRVLSSMQKQNGDANIENYPYYLLAALGEALALVGTVKCYDPSLLSSAKVKSWSLRARLSVSYCLIFVYID